MKIERCIYCRRMMLPLPWARVGFRYTARGREMFHPECHNRWSEKQALLRWAQEDRL